MKDRRRAGAATGGIVLLLVLVLGGGAYNYHRNWQRELESQASRPYSGYATTDLLALRDAAESELEAHERTLRRAKRRRAGAASDRGSVAANALQFEQTSRASRAIRGAAGEVAAREQLIEQLEAELGMRAGPGGPVAVHWKRLITL